MKSPVQKLLERQKQALVVYTGSNMGIEPGLECLRTLRREDGFTYRVLLTRSAAELLDVPAIRSALEPEELWIETPGDSPEALTARYDTILVPAMTVNTAAHVAACMADTPAAAIILDGLMRGKNVIVAADGCCPDNPERMRRGFHMTEALKNKLRENKYPYSNRYKPPMPVSGVLKASAPRAPQGSGLQYDGHVAPAQSTSSPPYSVQFMAMPKGVTNSGAAGFTTGVPRYFSKTSSN